MTTIPTFVNYVEGIYVGYRYYETAYAEAQAGNMDFDYDEAVVYPFGYGLSYTTFSQTMTEPQADGDGNITFDVTVTNTGDVAGKEVVEVYVNPPYTNGGVEKAAANLIEFDKTDLLEPGESQTIKRIGGREDTRRFLENLGFVVGGTVTVVSELGGNVIVNVKDSRVAVSREMASKIMV